MRRVVLLVIVAAAACSRAPSRPFPIGFLSPVSPRAAAAARRAGLEVASRAPDGAAVVSAAVPGRGGGEVTMDWAPLRFETARAIARGASGVFFRLPGTSSGRDYLEYVEESQSVERVLRELLSLRPIFQDGGAARIPFAVPDGVESRAWDYRGRRYVLLVNSAGVQRPFEERPLEPWRALFAVRSDPREALIPCGGKTCLPSGGVLWLEGRLFSDR